MSARKLLDAGYHKLVSVVPPDARLAPTTTLKDSARGKVPGVRRRDGGWVGYPWLQADSVSEADLQKWERWGSNIGLRADYFPGLDIDVDHEILAKVVTQFAHKFFGPAPVRLSGPPRRLLVYRADEPFGKLAAEIEYAGDKHTVEVLCAGRQYLVHGKHPSGVEYSWQGDPLWKTAPEDLTEITAEKVLEFFALLEKKLEGRAIVSVVGTGKTAAEDAPAQESLVAPSIDRLRAVVETIPNTYPDRDSYIEFGHAVKAAAGGDQEGLDIFLEWASRWTEGTNEPETVEADWGRMHSPFRVGWPWLVEQAEEFGDYETAQEEFEADPDAEPMDGTEEPIHLPSGVIEFTDTWVTERIAGWVRSKLRYVPETGQWHVWNGHAWAVDRRNQADYRIRQGLVQLSQEVRKIAGAHPDEKERKRLYKFCRDLQSRAALTKVVPELEAHPSITLTLEDFDSDDWLLNTPKGIVDLRTGRMRASDPDALLSKAVAVGPSFERAAPRWEAFMEEATGGDEDLARFLQKQVGYALTGSTQEQTMCFIHGPPLTGKSVFLETVGGLLGSYHESAAAETFAKTRGDRHPTDLAKLAGARLVTASETHEDRSWDTQRIKSITGGDRISARFMRQDFFDFRPTFKVVIVGNHEPNIDGVDDAMMRRLHVVPFEHPPDERDRLLPDKLKAEWPAILAWAIEGCLLWLEEGLDPPEAVRSRTEAYRRDEDPVGRFVDEVCEIGEDMEVSRKELYDAWRRWCHGQGEEPGTLKTLKRRFATVQARMGFRDARLYGPGGSRPTGYKGLGIKTTEEFGI